MSNDERDPIVRALDDLASLADTAPVGDRMAGISSKARTNRIRKAAAGGVSLMVVAAAAVGAMQWLPSDRMNGTQVATTPTVTSVPTVPGTVKPIPSPAVEPTPEAPMTPERPKGTASASATSTPLSSVTSGEFTMSLTATQIGSRTIGVVVHMTGKTPLWSSASGPTSWAGPDPTATTVHIGGESKGVLMSGVELGDIECAAGTKPTDFDISWGAGPDDHGQHFEVKAAGKYRVTVETAYCGVDGRVVSTEVSHDVTVADEAMVVTDQVTVDIDGDGANDLVKLMMPKSREMRGQSDYQVAEVTRRGGEPTEVLVGGQWRTSIQGTADLNKDGKLDVIVSSSGEDGSLWTVLTFDDGKVVAANPVEAGDQWPPMPPRTGLGTDGRYSELYLDNGKLMSWVSDDTWNAESTAKQKVTATPWVLDGRYLFYSENADDVKHLCVTGSDKNWPVPSRC